MNKIESYLLNQKKNLLALDGAFPETNWLTEKEISGKHAPGFMNAIYDNMIVALGGLLRKVGRVQISESGLSAPINEDTLTGAIATFTTSLLPGVRRIFQNMFAMDLVSVQPLTGPSGYLYYMDHVYTSTYADAKDTITAGDRLDQKRPVNYAGAGALLEKTEPRQIQFKLTSKLIATVEQKLRTDWTIEAEQDARSQWKVDIEGEMVPMLADETARETDRRIIEALYAGAAYNIPWNKNGKLGAGTDATSDALAYRETLYNDAVVSANAYILKKKYVNGSWVVMSPDTFVYFQRLNTFRLDPAAAVNMGSNIGIQYVGTLANMFRVYIAPWFYANKILMGMKGADWRYNVGYYAPYIPLFISEKYLINDDFTQFARGAMSRYAYGIIPEEAADSTTNDGLVTITITSS